MIEGTKSYVNCRVTRCFFDDGEKPFVDLTLECAEGPRSGETFRYRRYLHTEKTLGISLEELSHLGFTGKGLADIRRAMQDHGLGSSVARVMLVVSPGRTDGVLREEVKRVYAKPTGPAKVGFTSTKRGAVDDDLAF
jgi:hypothetical protein